MERINWQNCSSVRGKLHILLEDLTSCEPFLDGQDKDIHVYYGQESEVKRLRFSEDDLVENIMELATVDCKQVLEVLLSFIKVVNAREKRISLERAFSKVMALHEDDLENLVGSVVLPGVPDFPCCNVIEIVLWLGKEVNARWKDATKIDLLEKALVIYSNLPELLPLVGTAEYDLRFALSELLQRCCILLGDFVVVEVLEKLDSSVRKSLANNCGVLIKHFALHQQLSSFMTSSGVQIITRSVSDTTEKLTFGKEEVQSFSKRLSLLLRQGPPANWTTKLLQEGALLFHVAEEGLVLDVLSVWLKAVIASGRSVGATADWAHLLETVYYWFSMKLLSFSAVLERMKSFELDDGGKATFLTVLAQLLPCEGVKEFLKEDVRDHEGSVLKSVFSLFDVGNEEHKRSLWAFVFHHKDIFSSSSTPKKFLPASAMTESSKQALSLWWKHFKERSQSNHVTSEETKRNLSAISLITPATVAEHMMLNCTEPVPYSVLVPLSARTRQRMCKIFQEALNKHRTHKSFPSFAVLETFVRLHTRKLLPLDSGGQSFKWLLLEDYQGSQVHQVLLDALCWRLLGLFESHESLQLLQSVCRYMGSCARTNLHLFRTCVSLFQRVFVNGLLVDIPGPPKDWAVIPSLSRFVVRSIVRLVNSYRCVLWESSIDNVRLWYEADPHVPSATSLKLFPVVLKNFFEGKMADVQQRKLELSEVLLNALKGVRDATSENVNELAKFCRENNELGKELLKTAFALEGAVRPLTKPFWKAVIVILRKLPCEIVYWNTFLLVEWMLSSDLKRQNLRTWCASISELIGDFEMCSFAEILVAVNACSHLDGWSDMVTLLLPVYLKSFKQVKSRFDCRGYVEVATSTEALKRQALKSQTPLVEYYGFELLTAFSSLEDTVWLLLEGCKLADSLLKDMSDFFHYNDNVFNFCSDMMYRFWDGISQGTKECLYSLTGLPLVQGTDVLSILQPFTDCLKGRSADAVYNDRWPEDVFQRCYVRLLVLPAKEKPLVSRLLSALESSVIDEFEVTALGFSLGRIPRSEVPELVKYVVSVCKGEMNNKHFLKAIHVALRHFAFAPCTHLCLELSKAMEYLDFDGLHLLAQVIGPFEWKLPSKASKEITAKLQKALKKEQKGNNKDILELFSRMWMSAEK